MTIDAGESVKIVKKRFERYERGDISLSKLAELLEITLEEAKYELKLRNIPLNLGVESEIELLKDIENA